MNNATEKFIIKWEKNLTIGRKKYALKYGTIWGIIAGVLSLLFRYFSTRKEINFSINEVIIKIIIFIIAGFILYYFFLWKTYNNQYNKIKKNK